MIRKRLPALPRGSSAAWRPFFLLFAACFLGCSGTENGGIGDPPSEPLADPCGGGERLNNVVGPATWVSDTAGSCDYPLNRPVQLSGVRIVAIDTFDETGDGARGNYFVEDACTDPLGPYSGMTVYAPSFSPPDLRLAMGDVVDLIGNFQEFPGPSSGSFPKCRTLPEIGGTMSFRLELGPNLTPRTIDVKELKAYDTARPLLGMLVRIEDAIISDNPNESKGRFSVPLNVGGGITQADVPQISNELFDMKSFKPKEWADKNLDWKFEEGLVLKSVTGVVTYFYGFKIAPRSAADIEAYPPPPM